MNNNKSKKPKKVYDLALYGLTASGKTCVLTALAMPRHPHALGYSCTRVPASDKSSPALQEGQTWINQAIDSLRQQRVPQPNSKSGDECILEYDFIATHQTFRMKLMDYSGELLLGDSELVQQLRKRFDKMDGILFLAEAPCRNDISGYQQGLHKTWDGEAHRSLYDLRQAFALLRSEKQDGAAFEDVPVALLINKWDRYSQIDFNNPESERSKLNDFFNASPPPAHRGLRDELFGTVTQGNFKEFPVSALGPSQFQRLDNDKMVECPLQTDPLQSFGLEDAFIWIAQRCDAIDLQHYQNHALKNLRLCKQEGAELLNRFPTNSEETKQVKAVLRQCQRTETFRWIVAGAVIGAMWLGVEATMDFIHYHQHSVTSTDPQASDESLKRAEDWLLDYVKAPYFRHVVYRTFLSREQSQKMLTELQLRREKVLWEIITKAQAVNLQTAYAPASEYLQYYPYGPHSLEARDIKLRGDFQQKQQENEVAFHEVASRVQENMQDPEKLNQLLTELRKLPKHFHAETEELRNQRIALEQQLSTQVVQLASKRDWERFFKGYQDNMQTGNFLEAAQSLNNRPADDKVTPLKETFRTKVVQDIAEKVTQNLKDNRLDEANQFLKSYAQFPPDLQSGEGQAKMAELQQQILGRQDRDLYEAAKKYLDVEHFDKYLQYAPLKTMAGQVVAYKKYLGEIDPNATVEFRLVLKIEWGKVSGSEIHVRAWWNGNSAIYYGKNDKVKAEANSTTNWMGSDSLRAKPSDKVTITIKVDNIGWVSDDHYEAPVTNKEVSELASGYVVSLQDTSAHTEAGKAYLVLYGYPKPPELPEWHGVR